MPQYRNAADVRAAHPGVYDDLSDEQIEHGLVRQGASSTGDETEPLGPRYHPGLGDDPTSAVMGELGRTGLEALKGVARSPLDMVKALLHPIDTVTGLAHTVIHPLDTVESLAKSPRDAGSVLGQLLLAPKVPEAANAILREGPSMVGRGMGSVGRGAETAGKSSILKKAQALAPIEAATGHIGPAIASAVAPPILEYGGRALQRGGASLEGLDLSLKSRPPAAPVEDPIDPAADTVRETVRTARDLKDKGASPAQAASRAGWPLGKSSDVPYRADPVTPNTDLFPYQSEELANQRAASRIDALGKKIGSNTWADDVSAQPDSVNGLETALDSRITGLEPEEGLSPLDELSRLSGRAKFDRAQELLTKLGGRGRP